jgi:DHA2 family multidrug resistance protein-like MFS transporter
MGVGGGLAGPAAYTLLMQSVPAEHRGVGSAMNDTVQQTGAALSVAVLGSVLAAAYSSSLPDSVPEAARKSIAETLALGPDFVAEARSAFTDAMSIAMTTGLVGALAGALVALVALPRRRTDSTTPAADLAEAGASVHTPADSLLPPRLSVRLLAPAGSNRPESRRLLPA